MSDPVHDLHKIRRELDVALESILFALENRDLELIMALDLSALIALGPRIDAAAAAVASAEAGAGGVATSADQAALDAQVATLTTKVANLETAVGITSGGTPTPPATDTLTISPTSISGPVGTPISQTLTVSGGVAPYTISGDPGAAPPAADVSLSDGVLSVGGLVAEETQTTLIATDSSTPPLTSGPVTISISVA